MKVRSLKDIERDIRKETEKANTAAQYDMYASSIDDMFRAALAVAVTVFHRRGRSKNYIKKFVEDFMFILECPPIFGKQFSSTELMKQFEEEYDIDFSQIKVNCESKHEFYDRYNVREERL
jgi:hypothetical protein